MFKKLSLTLVAAAMLVLPALSVPSSAASQGETMASGQLLNNRVLIPLRTVSQHLGAGVEWSQQEKIVSINKGDSKILLAANFKRALVYALPVDPSNVKKIDLDAPAQVIQGTTYVPLRFVSQSLGANVGWNQQTKQATITVGTKKILVNMEQPTVSLSSKQRITDARLNLLSKKLNEAVDVSSIKNVSTHFKPYFTDKFIKSINQNKEKSAKYETPITSVEYTSKTTATLSESVIVANGLTAEDQYVEDRTAYLVYTGGVWKVDRVSHTIRVIPTGFGK
ncbi:copper amine oxidase N-terminal domain-containing protein [Paenibacillus albidus]|uniref:copper amine oxidase N-terminal domain-containing protein n=1 Tax=Paenibacillus albidus TaxID=2041023 RepID=UPI001BE5FBA9|nr:copper amine oxidase N-terminal domain-containing protein [Paenibacillus albidus]MBT2292833.1 copper amine oxidase N-terminal domain-containing protein [Paenibacillus albidus]